MLEPNTVITFLKVYVGTHIHEKRLLIWLDHFCFAIPIFAGGDYHKALSLTLLQKNLLR